MPRVYFFTCSTIVSLGAPRNSQFTGTRLPVEIKCIVRSPAKCGRKFAISGFYLNCYAPIGYFEIRPQQRFIWYPPPPLCFLRLRLPQRFALHLFIQCLHEKRGVPLAGGEIVFLHDTSYLRLAVKFFFCAERVGPYPTLGFDGACGLGCGRTN